MPGVDGGPMMPRVIVDVTPGAEGRVNAADRAQCTARVLLVEDHVDTLRTLQRLLGMMGHVVTAADGVAAAVAEADAADERTRMFGLSPQDHAPPAPFDVLVSDIGLHDGNGWDLMRQLRTRYPGLRGIAFSGYGMENDLRSSQAAGFEIHLIKPTGVAQIDEAIRTILRP